MSERVIVCGSRDFPGLPAVKQFVQGLAVFEPNAVVITGGARGPDLMAERTAYEVGLEVELYLPDWERYGKYAGIKRNNEMLQAAPTQIAAFHDGSSRGTAHMIREAKRRNIPLKVFSIIDGEINLAIF